MWATINSGGTIKGVTGYFFSHRPQCTFYLEFQLCCLKNLKLFSFGIKELFEPIDEVTCDVSAVEVSTVAPQYAHASLGTYF